MNEALNQSAKHEIRRILARKHQAIESLFDKFEHANKPDDKEDLVETIALALHSHLDLEENVLYPRLKQMPQGSELVSEITKGDDSVKLTIDELRRLFADLDACQYKDKMLELKSRFDYHIAISEQEVIPNIEKSGVNLSELANEMNGCRETPSSFQKNELNQTGPGPRHRFQPEKQP